MKAIVAALFAAVLCFLFAHRPVVQAVGHGVKMWKLLLFDLAVGVGVYIIAR